VTFSDKTLAELEKKLPHDVVKTRAQAGQKLSYVEGWYVLARANEVFGHDGWSCEVLSQTVLHSAADAGGKYLHVVRTHVRVRVGSVTRDGIGVAAGRSSGPAEAIELAEKAAETDAQKRALRTFGASLGLALYDKEHEGVGASREAQRLCEDVSRAVDVDAWAREHKGIVASLGPADQEEVKAAARARREQLGPRELPAPSASSSALLAPYVPAAGPLIDEIARAKGLSALALLADRLCAAPLNGSAAAVWGAYAARWVKGLDAVRDATSLAAARTAYETLDAELRRTRLDATVRPALERAYARCSEMREPGQEG
jgi:DNA recombination protein Rad52